MSTHTPGPGQVDRLRRRLFLVMHYVDELERKTGKGGWYAESIQETCDAIAADFGFKSYHDGFATDEAEAKIHRAAIAKATKSSEADGKGIAP